MSIRLLSRQYVIFCMAVLPACGVVTTDDRAADRPPDANRREDQLEPASEIVSLDLKDAPTLGVQHRYPIVVVDHPKSKGEVTEVVKRVYEYFAQDIERTHADATYKRMNIIVYGSHWEAEDRDGYHIAQIDTEAKPSIPEWNDDSIKWWRQVSNATSQTP